jgi:hypothetical protein
MRGQVGYWGSPEHGGLTVGFSHEMMSWLRARREDRRVCTLVDRRRRLWVVPDHEGAVVTPRQKNAAPFHYTSSQLPSSLVVECDLPIFGLLDVEFSEVDGELVAELPETDHELPWPMLDADCASYDPPAVAKECLQVRMNSIVASGLTTFPSEHRMPIRLRQMLPPGAWVECLATAKSLAGVR